LPLVNRAHLVQARIKSNCRTLHIKVAELHLLQRVTLKMS